MGGRPREGGVEDQGFGWGALATLGPNPPADAEVQPLVALERRDSHPASEALGAIVVLEPILGRLVFPLIGDPAGDVEPGCEGVRHLEPGVALRFAEARELGRRRREVQRGVVTLVAVGRIEAPEGDRQAVAERGDSRDVHPMQADLGGAGLAAELPDAAAHTRASETGFETMGVTVA